MSSLSSGTQTAQRPHVSGATLAGLLIALGGPPAFAIFSAAVRTQTRPVALQLALQAAFCGLAVALIVIVVRFERLPLQSIGLRTPDWSTLRTAALLLGCGVLLQVLVIGPLVARWARAGADGGIEALATAPAWFRVVLGVTGGAVEELLYRGYAVERIGTITGARWRGAVLATLAFAAAHIPAWGLPFAIAADLPAGILLVSFYLWRRDLAANMLAHSGGILIAMFTIVPVRT